MKNKSLRIFLGLTAALCVGLAGCAAEVGLEEEWDGAPYDDEEVASEELTVPPAGVGFEHIGTVRMRNAQYGDCAVRVGNVVGATTCSTSAAQKFAIYSHNYGASYSMCTPDTLQASSFACQGGTCTHYTATCVAPQGSSDVRMQTTTVSMNYTFHYRLIGSTYHAFPVYTGTWNYASNEGRISLDRGVYLQLKTGNCLTRSGSAVVVQGHCSPATNHPNQQWSNY